MTTGHIIEHLRDWRLDKARYGSECFFWVDSDNVDKLIVISGMDDTSYEFTDEEQWFQDVNRFTIPGPEGIFFPPFMIKTSGIIPADDNMNQELEWNLIDAKPILVENYLYFIGGKTSLESKPYVSKMELTNFENSNGQQIEAEYQLTNGRALPLVDTVLVNFAEAGDPDEIGDCRMAFSGQSYADRQMVPVDEGGIVTDYLELFCRDSTVVLRRRLQDDDDMHIPSFTEFDLEMFKKGKERDRRRLAEGEEVEESEVFIRHYQYGLDGLYYNFSVVIEQCFANNDELSDAEEYYTSIIASKNSDDTDEWMAFKVDLDAKILNKSKEAYRGWNDYGFGVVDIWNLKILNVTYEVTASPTTPIPTRNIEPETPEPTPMPIKESGCHKHTERRKARYLYKNYEDKDIVYDDDMWIDNKFDKVYAKKENQ